LKFPRLQLLDLDRRQEDSIVTVHYESPAGSFSPQANAPSAQISAVNIPSARENAVRERPVDRGPESLEPAGVPSLSLDAKGPACTVRRDGVDGTVVRRDDVFHGLDPHRERLSLQPLGEVCRVALHGSINNASTHYFQG
jgi:hypothetical protein